MVVQAGARRRYRDRCETAGTYRLQQATADYGTGVSGLDSGPVQLISVGGPSRRRSPELQVPLIVNNIHRWPDSGSESKPLVL